MPRGRPKGSGKRWTPFLESQLYARMTFIMERDNTDKSTAAKRMVVEGYFQVREGKLWVTRDAHEGEHHGELIAHLQGTLKLGDARTWDMAEVFRTQYHAIQRKIKADEALRADCEFWLRVEREGHRIGDRYQAFMNVLEGVDTN